MNKHRLAKALRKRQREKGYFPKRKIAAMSDDLIIAAYTSCCRCGKKLSAKTVAHTIAAADDVDKWLYLIAGAIKWMHRGVLTADDTEQPAGE